MAAQMVKDIKPLEEEKKKQLNAIGKFKSIIGNGEKSISGAKAYWEKKCTPIDGKAPENAFSVWRQEGAEQKVYSLGQMININGQNYALNSFDDFVTAYKLDNSIASYGASVYNFKYMITGPAVNVMNWVNDHIGSDKTRLEEYLSMNYDFTKYVQSEMGMSVPVPYLLENRMVDIKEYIEMAKIQNKSKNKKTKDTKEGKELIRTGGHEKEFNLNEAFTLKSALVVNPAIVTPALISYMTKSIKNNTTVLEKGVAGVRGGRPTDVSSKIAEAVKENKILNIMDITATGSGIKKVMRPTVGGKSNLVPLNIPQTIVNGISYVFYKGNDPVNSLNAIKIFADKIGVDPTPYIQGLYQTIDNARAAGRPSQTMMMPIR